MDKLVAGMYSFGGWVFPPHQTSYGSTNLCAIARIEGEFYFFDSEYIGGYGFNAWHTDDGYFACWTPVGVYKFTGSKWVALKSEEHTFNSNYVERRGGYQLCPKQCLLWAAANVGNMVGYTFYSPDHDGNYMVGSQPVLLSDYPELPTVTAYGWNDYPGVNTTGPKVTDQWLPLIAGEDAYNWRLEIYLVCHASVSDGGTVTVEWYRNGELYATHGDVGSLQSYPKPTCDEAGTFTYFAVVTNDTGTYKRSITLDPFTFTVVDWNLDTNTPKEDETPDDEDDPSYDDDVVIEDSFYEEIPEEERFTPDDRRVYFWKGFASAVGMYGGAVVNGSNGVATSESDGYVLNERRAAYWRGFACGVAVSNLARNGGKSSGGNEGSGGAGNDNTTSILGKAILGTMLLGE